MSNAINSTKLEALVAENKRCFSKDLASAAEQLYALENHIQGRPGAFAQLLRIAYELNEDFEQRFDKVANEICEAIQDSDQVYGRAIAKYLYNTQTIVLPSELGCAAHYLSCGGNEETLADLAAAGFFGADSTHDELCRVIAYMNAGGSADHAAYAAEHADTDLERNGSMTLS